MKTVFVVSALQRRPESLRKRPESKFEGRPTGVEVVFESEEEADFYCETHSTHGLVYWWESIRIGSMKAAMKDAKRTKRRRS